MEPSGFDLFWLDIRSTELNCLVDLNVCFAGRVCIAWKSTTKYDLVQEYTKQIL